MLRVLWPLLLIAFTVYNLISAIQTKDADVRSLPKIVWIILILLFPLVGGIAWLMAGRTRTGSAGPIRRPSPPRRGPLGPDDDPEFLRRL